MFRRSFNPKAALCFTLCLTLFGCANQSLSAPEETEAGPQAISAAARPSFLSPSQLSYQTSVTPAVPDYTLADDFSNVVNIERFYLSEDLKNDLRKNLFAVGSIYGFEFHELYEENRYSYKANFVTTDSLLHAYHLYYAYLQKNAERQFLRDRLNTMSGKLLEETRTQCSALQGTPFEAAAQRNLDIFSVAYRLSGADTPLSDPASQEVALIEEASGLNVSPLFSAGDEYIQDYSQLFHLLTIHNTLQSLRTSLLVLRLYSSTQLSRKAKKTMLVGLQQLIPLLFLQQLITSSQSQLMLQLTASNSQLTLV